MWVGGGNLSKVYNNGTRCSLVLRIPYLLTSHTTNILFLASTSNSYHKCSLPSSILARENYARTPLSLSIYQADPNPTKNKTRTSHSSSKTTNIPSPITTRIDQFLQQPYISPTHLNHPPPPSHSRSQHKPSRTRKRRTKPITTYVPQAKLVTE